MMKKIIVLLAILPLLFSCAVGPSLFYNVGLSNVEVPADVKKQYGETKIVKLDIEGKTNYNYTDDYVDISWIVSSTQFNFVLKNKGTYSIKIPWDEVTYINSSGQTGRVMHSGVKYIDRNNSQPPSIVPKNASLSDVIIPTDNIYYVSGQYGGWREGRLFNFPIDKSNIEISKAPYIGKTVRILLPIVIENIRNEYVFEFKIDDILVK